MVDYQDYHEQVFDMTMFNPPHPSSILKEDISPKWGIGVTKAAIELLRKDLCFTDESALMGFVP